MDSTTKNINSTTPLTPPPEKEWTQTELPSTEQLNLDIQLLKERLTEMKRQNAPPKGAKFGWRKTRTLMRIKARSSNAKHAPYWNKEKHIELGIRNDQFKECSKVYSDVLSHFIQNKQTGRHFAHLNLYRPETEHSVCNCVYFQYHHIKDNAQRFFSYPTGHKIGEEVIDFNEPVFFKPGVTEEFNFFMSGSCQHSREGIEFLFPHEIARLAKHRKFPHLELNTTLKAKALWTWAVKSCIYGSFERGFKEINNGLTVGYNNRPITIDASLLQEAELILNPKTYAWLCALYHGGVSDRYFDTSVKYYKKMFQFCTQERFIELEGMIRDMIKSSDKGKWRGDKDYRKLVDIPELNYPIRFLKCVTNVFDYLCKFTGIKCASRTIPLSTLWYATSSHMFVHNPTRCKHDNKKGTGKDLFDITFNPDAYFRPDTQCNCKEPLLHSKFVRNSKRIIKDKIENIVGPEATSDDGFFAYIRSLYTTPSAPPTDNYPEEGGCTRRAAFGVDHNVKLPQEWLERAMKLFFDNLKSFVKEICSEFSSMFTTMIDAVVDNVKTAFSSLNDSIKSIASPMVSILEKFLKTLGLSYFVEGRDLNSDVILCMIGSFVFNLFDNPIIKLVIILFFTKHFNLIKNTSDFLKYLKNSFFSKQDEAILEDEAEGPQPTSFFVSFLTYLSSANSMSVIVKTITAVILSVAGVAASTANKASLCKIVIEGCRNLAFIGQGINGFGKLWSVISEIVPKVLQWVRKVTGVKTDEDIKSEQHQKDIEKCKAQTLNFITFMELMDCEDGFVSIKRSKKLQDKIVKMRPLFIQLKRCSLNPKFSDVFVRDILSAFNKACKSYTKLFDIVFRVCAYGNFRRTPFHIQLMGPPGVGKSTLLKSVAYDMRAHYFPDVPDNHLIFARGKTDHFDGYSNQPIMIQDDMWSVDDYKEVSEILPLISNVPIVVPMAHLSDKATFFDSQFILSTTNIAFPTTTAVRCNPAIWRRRHIFARVSIDPDVYDTATSKFCMEKFKCKYPNMTDAERNSSMPHLSFDILSPMPSGNGPEIQNGKVIYTKDDDYLEEFNDNAIPSGLTKPLKGISYYRFMQLCRDRRDAMIKEEDSVRSASTQQQNILKNTRELYNLISDIQESADGYLGPVSSSFLDFDFADTEEAQEPDVEEGEEESEDLGEDASWDEEEDQGSNEWETEEEDAEATAEAWLGSMTEEDREFYFKFMTESIQWRFDHKSTVISFLAKYESILPPNVKSLLRSIIEMTDPDPEKERRYKLYNKYKSKAHLSRKEREIFNKLREEFEGAASSSSTPPPPEYTTNIRTDEYIPVAGEYPRTGVFDSRPDRGYFYPTVATTYANHNDMHCIRIPSAEKPQMMHNHYAKVHADFCKPGGGIFGNWTNSVHEAGLFKATFTTYDKIKISSQTRISYGNIEQDLENHAETIASIPLDFLNRIGKIDFKYNRVSTSGQLEVVNDPDYAIQFSMDEKYGAMSLEQWEEMSGSVLNMLREKLSYAQRNQFNEYLSSDPASVMKRDPERKRNCSFFCPLFVSSLFSTYARAFSSLPTSIKENFANINSEGVKSKINILHQLKQRKMDLVKYYLIKYSSYLRKTPVPAMIGVGDAIVTILCGIYGYLIYSAIKKIFCTLFGFPSSTSRIMFKRGTPPNLRPRVPLPTSYNPTEDMHLKITRNIVQVLNDRGECANALGVDGQVIMANLHIFREQIERGEDFICYWRPTPNSPEFWEATVRIKDVKIVPNSDVVFIKSVDFRAFSKIKHLFIKESDLYKFELPRHVFQTFYNREGNISVQSSSVEGLIDSLDVRFLDTSICRVIEYNAPRVKGLSGSPLYMSSNYTQGRSILGLQTCALSDRSFMCVITQEDIEQYSPKSIRHEGPKLINDEPTPTSDLISEHLCTVGSIPKDKVAGIVSKTEYLESIFQEQFPSDSIPAILNAFDSRVPSGDHPLRHSVNKFGRNSIKSMPTNVIDEAVEAISNHIKSKLPSKLRVMTLEESILGLEEAGFEKINLKTSPGIPWIYEKVLPGKKTWVNLLEDGELLLKSEVIENFNLVEDQMKKGIIPANSFYEFPKDELRPAEKALGPPIKTRSITVMNFIFSLIYRKYCLDLEAQLHQFADGTFPSCVGINPHSPSWANMYRELKTRSNFGNDFDISNWDGHFPGWLFNAVCSVFNNCYDDEFHLVRQSLFTNAAFGYTNFLDCVLQKNRGMPSGFAGTAIVNTIGHYILFYCFYIIQCQRNNIPYEFCQFKSHIASFFYGDDVVFSMSEELKSHNVTPSGFIELYREFGWPITSASKISDPAISRRIEDLQFLKRSFKIDQTLGTFVVLAPIDKMTINNVMHWQRKSVNELQQTLVNVNEALEFAYSHGHDFYNSVFDRASIVLRRKKFKQALPTYKEMRRRMLDRYFNA